MEAIVFHDRRSTVWLCWQALRKYPSHPTKEEHTQAISPQGSQTESETRVGVGRHGLFLIPVAVQLRVVS